MRLHPFFTQMAALMGWRSAAWFMVWRFACRRVSLADFTGIAQLSSTGATAACLHEWPFVLGASMARSPRPLSPHLQIYRWQWTMALSILHRTAGVALGFGSLLLVYWLFAAARGPAAFSRTLRRDFVD